jgi:IrrE N-terminal-like domain
MPRSRDWSEPLVRKLIQRHKGKPPEDILEAYAESLLKESEQDRLPIDVELVASVLGIRRRVAPFGFAGRIYAEPSGQLVMDLNGDDNPRRQRFTASHEIMHTAFPGFKREARYRADTSSETHPRNREEEHLCDLGAAALLMPRRMVSESFSVTDGLGAIQALAEEADVSLEAAGNRLVSLSPTPAVFMVFSMAHKPADGPALRRGDEVAKRLRLHYATTAHIDLYLPRYKGAQDGSALCRAWESRKVERGSELLPGAEPAGTFLIEAKAYGTDDNRRVLATAFPHQVRT